MTGRSGDQDAMDGADEVARMLERLRHTPLSETALARVRANVEREWRLVALSGRRSRRIRLAGIAAAFMVFTVGGALAWHLARPAPLVGTVSRVLGGGLASHSYLWPDQALSPGTPLHAGDELHARGPAAVALQSQDSLRMASGTMIRLRSSGDLELLEGRIYLDLPPGRTSASPMRVQTAAGVIEHLGTQFEVATAGRDVRIRVREGSVRLLRPAGSEIATAGTELTASPEGSTSRRAIATHGSEWNWAEGLTSGLEVEGRSLIDFLHWAGREMGLQLEFADSRASDVALRTSLHGSLDGVPPLEALNRVLSTTSLEFQLGGDAIRVSSRRMNRQSHRSDR